MAETRATSPLVRLSANGRNRPFSAIGGVSLAYDIAILFDARSTSIVFVKRDSGAIHPFSAHELRRRTALRDATKNEPAAAALIGASPPSRPRRKNQRTGRGPCRKGESHPGFIQSRAQARRHRPHFANIPVAGAPGSELCRETQKRKPSARNAPQKGGGLRSDPCKR
jgi:hypothetical protein